MSNEPTPETESWCGWGIGGLQVVPASFSRKLERERDEAREQRDALAEAIITHRAKAFPLTGEDFDQELWQALQSLTTNKL